MGTRKLISFDWALKKLLRSKVNQFDGIARDKLDEWIYFLKNEEIKDEFSARGLREAKSKLDVMKLPEQERIAYQRYLDDLSYQASMVQSSYGIGVIEGGKEKAVAIARALKAKGIPDEVIAETTGLTLDEWGLVKKTGSCFTVCRGIV